MNNSKYFTIEWKTFDSHLINSSKELLSEKVFTDVTLVSDDMKTVKAHRIILSRASRVLKQLLEINPSANPLLYLKGISSANLTSILEFIYAGQTQVPTERINEFIKASDELEISELSTNQELSDKNSSNFVTRMEDSFDNVLTGSSTTKKDEVSSLMIENTDVLFDLNEKLIEEDIIEKKKVTSHSKRKSKGERKNSKTSKILVKESSDKEDSFKNQGDIKANYSNPTENIDAYALKEKNIVKGESKQKEDRIYKVDDLVCSRCFEIFYDQILYLQHMAQC